MGHSISRHLNYPYDGSPARSLPANPPAPPPAAARAEVAVPVAAARAEVPVAAHPVQTFRNYVARRIHHHPRTTIQDRHTRRTRHTRPVDQPATVVTRPAVSPHHPGNHPSGSCRPNKFNAILSNPIIDQETLEKHSWNPEDRSQNIFVKEDDKLTFHRQPVAQSTDCVRGKEGYSNGFHVWKITFPVTQRGTNAVIGVATKEAPLHQAGYVSLIGQNTESYGWDIKSNKCGHDSRQTPVWQYPNAVTANGRAYVAPDNIYCILDMEEGYMAFATDNNYLGVAFRGLKGKTLYPIVSCVWGHCEVTLKYLGGFDPEPRQLMDACRKTILSSLGKEKEINEKIITLPLPSSVKNFLLYLDGS